jgi:predicted PurR-regulated permease PerM
LGIILAVPVAAALMEFANDIQKEKARHSSS